MTAKDLQIKGELFLDQLLKVVKSNRSIEAPCSRKLPWAVDFSIVSDLKMRQVHSRYLKKRKLTDVLSFPSPSHFQVQGILGEIIICRSKLRSQAKLWNHSEIAELQVLLAHGVLHLLGYDHEESARAAAQMKRLESLLLKRFQTKGLIARQL